MPQSILFSIQKKACFLGFYLPYSLGKITVAYHIQFCFSLLNMETFCDTYIKY